MIDGFFEDPEEAKEARKDVRCTPDLLLAFLTKLGYMPTLHEIKKEFGGLLGAYLSAWQLQKEGRWPKLESQKQMVKKRAKRLKEKYR